MRQNKMSTTFLLAAVRGVCVGFAVIAVIFAFLATLVAGGKLSAELMPMAVAAAVAVGAFGGAIAGAGGFGARKLLCGLAVGSGMLLLCLVISALAEHGAFPNKHHARLTAAMLGGGVLGGLMSANLRRRPQKTSRKTKHR